MPKAARPSERPWSRLQSATARAMTERLDRRLADGLVEMAHHALDGGAIAQRVGQRPHLQVTTTLETLLQRCGAPAADLELSVPISARAVERLACDCNVTRMLLNADSQVIDVGRTTRKIRGSTRRALNARDNGCRWPGCDRAASYTSGHHLKHWIAGGSTDLSNLVLLWGLLPNSNRVATISTTLVLAHVTAGGSALDGVQSGRAEALPELLVGRRGSCQPHRASTRGCGRLRIRTQSDQAALQQHWTAVGRPNGPVQALAAWLPLQHSERASTLRGRLAEPGLAVVPGLRTRRGLARPQRADQGPSPLRDPGLRALL